MPKNQDDYKKYIQTGVIGLLTLTLGLTGYAYYDIKLELEIAKERLQESELQLDDAGMRFESLIEERNYIYDNLLSEQSKNELFENGADPIYQPERIHEFENSFLSSKVLIENLSASVEV